MRPVRQPSVVVVVVVVVVDDGNVSSGRRNDLFPQRRRSKGKQKGKQKRNRKLFVDDHRYRASGRKTSAFDVEFKAEFTWLT